MNDYDEAELPPSIELLKAQQPDTWHIPTNGRGKDVLLGLNEKVTAAQRPAPSGPSPVAPARDFWTKDEWKAAIEREEKQERDQKPRR